MEALLLRATVAALWAIAFVAACGAGGETQASESSTPLPSFEFHHGLIVDRPRGVLYLGAPEGAVEAVDLSTGRSLWRTGKAALPLALQGRVLAVQGEDSPAGPRLQLSALDVLQGGRSLLSASIPLPDRARAIVADEAGRAFRARAEDEPGGFLLSWWYTETQLTGVTRSPGEPLPQWTVSGAARVDLLTGRVIAGDTIRGRPLPSPPPDSQGTVPAPPWRAGDVLTRTEGGRGGPLTLKRWDATSGEALPDLVLVPKAVTSLPSADQQHLLASERVGAGTPADPEYRWSIFSLANGERVGELRRDESALPFFVWKEFVVFRSQPYGRRSGDDWVEEPLAVRAVRLSGGRAAWDRAIRDLEYRGTTPPAR